MSGRRGESDQDEGGPDAGVMRAEEAVRQGLLGWVAGFAVPVRRALIVRGRCRVAGGPPS